MKTITVYVRDKVYYPARSVDVPYLKDYYTRMLYKDSQCASCENYEDRHNQTCDACQAYLGTHKFFSMKEIKGKVHIGLPIGDKEKLQKITGVKWKSVKVVDKRVNIPFKHKIKFTLKLREHQQKAFDKFLINKYGLLVLPPRSGKCVTGSTLIHTEFGLHPIKDLFSKDHADGEELPLKIDILTRDGVQQTSGIYKKCVDKTIKVQSYMGFSVRGTENHPILILNKNLDMVWRNLEDVKEDDVICIKRDDGILSTSDYVSQSGKVITPKTARLLGYLVANGSLGRNGARMSFCTRNEKIMKDFINCVKAEFNIKLHPTTNKVEGVPTVYITSRHIKSTLAEFGLKFVVSKHKTIPTSIMLSSKRIVVSFLESYIGCDSYFPKKHKDEIELCSASKTLINQLQVLLLSFGIISKKVSKLSYARNSNTPTLHRYWHLFIPSVFKNSMYDNFRFKKPIGEYALRDSSDMDKIPYLGERISKIHLKYHNYGMSYSVRGKPVTTNRFGKILPNYSKSPIELPNDMKWSVACNLNHTIIEQLEPKYVEKINKIKQAGYFFDRITKVREINAPVDVYDVCVPSNSSFVANGIVVHNTALALGIGIELGMKFIWLADQYEFLTQFLDHVYGNEAEGIPCCTNVADIEERVGHKIAGIPKTDKDYEQFDIMCMTYQQFLHNEKRFAKARKNCAVLGIDEVHSSAAAGYAKVISKFYPSVKFGVTGTVERKDGLHTLLYKVIGPVIFRSHIEMLVPTVHVHESGIRMKNVPKHWTYLTGKLANNNKRNKLIVKQIVADVKAGHSCAVVCTFIKHTKLLVSMINKELGKNVAEAFIGGAGEKHKRERKEILSRAKSGKTKVVVGIRRLMQRGLNVPRWSCIHIAMPISNEPNLKQETMRICTPMEGKKSPIIRLYVDSCSGASMGCGRNSVKSMMKFKYNISKDADTKTNVALLMQSGGRESNDYDQEEYGVAKMKTTRTSPKRLSNSGSRSLRDLLKSS